MSDKWIKTKISSLASGMTDGPFGSDLKTVHYTDKREARIVQLSNIGEDGWVDDNIKYTTFKHAHEIGRCIIEPGNIIVAKMMPAGRSILCPNHEPMFVQGSDVVQIIPNAKIDSIFFVYMTKQNDYLQQIERNIQGSTRARTSISKLKEITFTIPESIDTQKRISTILSTCDTVIQNTQKTIEKYKAIKQGMMQDLFTRGLTKDGELRPSFEEAPELYKDSELGMIPKEWEVDSIGNNYITYAGGTPSREHDEYYKGDIPWVSSSECNQYEINETLEHITNIAVQRSSAKMVKAGAILLALYGATAGQVAKLNLDATTNQAVLACLSNSENDNTYLFYYLGYIKEKMLYLAQGSGQPNLSKASVDNFVYLKPCKYEQTEIAKRISAIDLTIQKEEAILSKYKNIKTGLMARLLTPPADAEIIDETEE